MFLKDKIAFQNQLSIYLVAGIITFLPISIRLSTFCVFLFLANEIVSGNWKYIFLKRKSNLVVLFFIAYYLLGILSYFFCNNQLEARAILEKKAALTILPAFLFMYFEDEEKIKKISNWYIYAIHFIIFICLLLQSYSYLNVHNWNVFIYHNLGSYFKLNAIYFSLFVFFAFYFQLQKFIAQKLIKEKTLYFFPLLFLGFSLFLLSSKMMLSIGCGVIFMQLIFISNVRLKLILFFLIGIAITCVVKISNPIKERFLDLEIPSKSFIFQKEYTSETYLNGLNMRLIWWRFGKEILQTKNSFLLGVGSGDSQDLLDEKIIQAKLFTGKEGGYLKYNFHNQYMETFVQYGFVGFSILAFLLIYIFFHAVQTKNFFLLVIILTYCILFLSESVLERQWGIISFIFFICMYWKYDKKSTSNREASPIY